MPTINITSEKELNKVIDTDKLVIADFWADWCGPCRIQSPILETLVANYPDDVVIAKIDVDKNEALSKNYKISSIPTMILFSEGKSQGTPIIGVTGLRHLESIVSNFKNK